MPAVWQRHPRYSLTILITLLTTFFLLSPYQQSTQPAQSHRLLVDNGLPARIARAEQKYEKMLTDRQAMIKRFGPTHYDVVMFPPNRDPWPAYTVWDFFPAIFNCPHEVERVGNMGDGGRWLCGLSRVEDKKDCVVYSFGFSWETSFELELLERTTACRIWTYDATVKDLGGIPRSHRHRTKFQPFELSPTDEHGGTPKKYTLDTLMKLNGHTYIDILKVDAEGGEFATFSKFVRSHIAADRPLPFGQLILEIHLWGKKFSEVLAFWELLEAAGLRPFRNEPNLVYQNYNKESNTELAEYSFLNIRGQNIFVADPTPPTLDVDSEAGS